MTCTTQCQICHIDIRMNLCAIFLQEVQLILIWPFSFENLSKSGYSYYVKEKSGVKQSKNTPRPQGIAIDIAPRSSINQFAMTIFVKQFLKLKNMKSILNNVVHWKKVPIKSFFILCYIDDKKNNIFLSGSQIILFPRVG